MRVGIIGTGWGARVQVPALRAAGLDVVALAGRDPAKTAAEAARLQVAPCTDWQALLEHDIELVSIVTPPVLHHAMTVAALEAGKHVLCEKPMALNATEARAMLAAAAAHPHQLTLIDHELRFLPAWQAARTVIENGELGRLRHATSTVVASGRSDASRPWTWWSDAVQGGGLWAAIGSHQIDTLRFLWGEIEAISAVLHTFVSERPGINGPQAVTADDFAAVHLRFVGGGFASLTLSLIAALDQPNTLTIHGDAGALRLAGGRLSVAARGGAWIDRTPDDYVSFPAHLPGNDFDRGTVYLGRALQHYGSGNREAIDAGATFRDGLRNQLVLDAGRQSHAAQGVWIDVPHE